MNYKSPAIHRTPLYRAKSAYSGMKRRCVGGKAPLPAYANVELRMSLEEWLTWAVPRYAQFDKEHPGETPHASRNGDQGHYEIGNIEIVTSAVNRAIQKRPRAIRPDGTKECVMCRIVKNGSEFYNNRTKSDGLADECKGCRRMLNDNQKMRR